MLFLMDVSTSLSLDSLLIHQEIRFSQQNILYVLLWKLFMDCLGVDRGVPEVWGSVYDIRELLDSSVKLNGWQITT